MTGPLLHFVCFVASMLFTVKAQQLDPIKNMCQRFDHQATIKNNTLYIDGGRQTFVDLDPVTGQKLVDGNVTVTEGYNSYLIAIDLSTSWIAANVSQKAIPKISDAGPELPVPILSRGALYTGRLDDNNLYLWGGTTSSWNESFPGYVPPLPPQFSLWSYNPTSQKWNTFDTGRNVQNRPSSGPSAEAADQGLAFYLNGGIDDHSQAGDQFRLDNDSKPFLQGMIVVDTVNKTARNISTTYATGDYPISRGKMEYIKNVGSNGILVTIGGNTKNVQNYTNTYVGDLVPMDDIDIFDVASYYNVSTPSGMWYKQKATGDIPERRLDHCLMTASAPDNSSHNIYMVGGRASDGTKNIYFDDVYVLSLPAFTWTKLYQGSSPSFAHQCLRANSRMMIRSGGARSFSFDKLPCDERASGISVFDISESKYVDAYDSSPQEYLLPTQVVAAIGGNRTGGATKLAPDDGFHQDGLALLFNKDEIKGTHKPRRVLPSAPFIIAGVLGSVAIVGVGGAFSFVYRRRLHAIIKMGDWRVEIDGQNQSWKAEMEATPVRVELAGPGTSATPIKYVEPSSQPVELSVRESDLPWRELPPRGGSPRWKELDGKGRPSSEAVPPAWEPPVTVHGVPF